MFCFHLCWVFKRCCFKFMPVTVPFSKSTVFEICRQKMCRFRVNGRPIRRIFHRFQNVPASCERSLKQILASAFPHLNNYYIYTYYFIWEFEGKLFSDCLVRGQSSLYKKKTSLRQAKFKQRIKALIFLFFSARNISGQAWILLFI